MQVNSNTFSRRLAFMAFSATGGLANTTTGDWYFGSTLGTKFTSENWNRGAGIGTVTPLHPSRLASSNLAPLRDGGGASFLRSFTGEVADAARWWDRSLPAFRLTGDGCGKQGKSLSGRARQCLKLVNVVPRGEAHDT